MASWKGSIIIKDGLKIDNLQLSEEDGETGFSLPPSPLQLLSIVHTHKVPLYLTAGPTLLVQTNSEASQAWFTRILLHEQISALDDSLSSTPAEADGPPWFETAQLQSSLGILARVFGQPSLEESSQPRISEILFYAAKVSKHGLRAVPADVLTGDNDEDGVSIHMYAVPLSSDLLYKTSFQDSSTPIEENQGHLLTPTHDRLRRDIITKKHERINGIFDTAPDRRKRARHLRAQSISDAAASAADMRPIKVEDSGLWSTKFGEVASTKSRPISQSGRVPSGPGADVRSHSGSASAREWHEPKRSSLSQQTTTEGFGEESLETKNKQLISRLVILGMRMFGLHQRKASCGIRDGHDGGDDEFKAIYHQTYLGVTFAFRRSINTQVLAAETVRDTADQLLRLFCTTPPGTNGPKDPLQASELQKER